MPEPYSYFSALLQASTAAISIVLVFVITIYATRQSIRQELDMRFENEVRQMSDAYFKEFEEISRKISLIESDSIDLRLLFNAGTETDQLTAEKIHTWADKQVHEELAAVFGHIMVAYFSLESFEASPYIEYKKIVFENLGDHLLEVNESLLSKEVKQSILESSEITEKEYKEIQSMIDDVTDDWISISTKNYTIDIVNKGDITDIVESCKWLFVVGVLVPLLFLIHIPPSAWEYVTALIRRILGNIGNQLTHSSSLLIFTAQLLITLAVIWLAWRLLRQVHKFFDGFDRPDDSIPQGKKLDEIEDIPNIPNEMFNE